MDILRKFCDAVPDGMTGYTLANALSLAFVDAIEKDVISSDFIQDEIVDLQPSLVSSPLCDTFPTPPFVTAVFNMVNEFEPFWETKSMDTTRNLDGEEYSSLMRNLASTDGAHNVGKSVEKIWDDVKNTYPRYYRFLYDEVPLCKVAIGENGEKIYSTVIYPEPMLTPNGVDGSIQSQC